MPTTLDLTAQLAQAWNSRQLLAAWPESGPASVEQAYAVQQAVWRQLAQQSRPTAWKAGAPDRQAIATAAAVLPLRIVKSSSQRPAQFPAALLRRLGIEAEIAVCFGRDLPLRAEPYRHEEILAAIASVHVAMELVDTRLNDPEKAGPLWRLADSLLNGGLVLGEAIPNWRMLDFSGLTVRIQANASCLGACRTLVVDSENRPRRGRFLPDSPPHGCSMGQEAGKKGAGAVDLQPTIPKPDRLLVETLGRPPLDDLFFCLPWWIEHVGGAQTGDIVTTGAWNGVHWVDMPAKVTVEFLGVDSVSAHIE